MNVGEVYKQFRSDMVDLARPYLWADEDVFRYMNDAYSMFVRLTGGIADFTSELTKVDIVAGEKIGELDRRILRVMEAHRQSDGAKIEVINVTDMAMSNQNDYGLVRPLYQDSTPGPVRYMVIGEERGKCRWAQIPLVDDTALLNVYRLPLVTITPATDKKFEFDDIGEEHHSSLVLWMAHKAYLKADADTFDRGRSNEFGGAFAAYCAAAKDEWERYKHKTRVVSYGGL